MELVFYFFKKPAVYRAPDNRIFRGGPRLNLIINTVNDLDFSFLALGQPNRTFVSCFSLQDILNFLIIYLFRQRSAICRFYFQILFGLSKTFNVSTFIDERFIVHAVFCFELPHKSLKFLHKLLMFLGSSSCCVRCIFYFQ